MGIVLSGVLSFVTLWLAGWDLVCVCVCVCVCTCACVAAYICVCTLLMGLCLCMCMCVCGVHEYVHVYVCPAGESKGNCDIFLGTVSVGLQLKDCRWTGRPYPAIFGLKHPLFYA